jgi:hypothetical protein
VVNPDDIPLTEIACTNCGTRGQWTEPRQFSGLLKTFLGVVEDESGLRAFVGVVVAVGAWCDGADQELELSGEVWGQEFFGDAHKS